MAAPPWYHTHTMFGDDSRTSDPAEIAEVDLLDQNTSNTTAYWDGFDPHMHKYSRIHAREKKREREGERRGKSHRFTRVLLPHPTWPLYIGEGGGAAGHGEVGTGGQGGSHAPNPNPSRPNPLAHGGGRPLVGLPSGRGPLRWVAFYLLNKLYILILIHLTNI
jgi:hypothetical protein